MPARDLPQAIAGPVPCSSLGARFAVGLPRVLADSERLTPCESPSGDLVAVAR
jgi:hypothetical protein